MRTSRLLLIPMLVAAIAGAACSGELTNPLGPPGGSSPAPEILAAVSNDPKAKKLASCKPLPAISTSASIGLLGGTIRVGPHSLWIPPGAVLARTTITARIVANDASNSVQFFPEGLRFKAPALLTLSYANCTNPSPLLFMNVVYTSNDLRSILELLPSIDNPLKKVTIGTLSHFSRYAIAY